MTTISPAPLVPSQTPTFKGIKKTEKGVPYHHSNTATIIGAGVAGLSLIKWGALLTSYSILKKNGYDFVDSNIKAVLKEQGNRFGKYGYAFAGIAAACSIGCGVLVDYIRNKKAKEVAEEYVLNPNQALASENMEYSEEGVPYFKSKIGLKTGALLGATCGILEHMMICTKSVKNKMLTGAKGTLQMVIGGLLVGALADSLTNSKSKKASNEMYFRNRLD